MKRWAKFREWVLREAALWRGAWIENSRGDTIVLSLERYKALLASAAELDEAQETMRKLCFIAKEQNELIGLQQAAMERETQALIDRMPNSRDGAQEAKMPRKAWLTSPLNPNMGRVCRNCNHIFGEHFARKDSEEFWCDEVGKGQFAGYADYGHD